MWLSLVCYSFTSLTLLLRVTGSQDRSNTNELLSNFRNTSGEFRSHEPDRISPSSLNLVSNGTVHFICDPDRYFACRDERCISKRSVCDTYRDCDEGEDELLTNCSPYTMRRFTKPDCKGSHYCANSTYCTDKVCDHSFDCPHHDDELNCSSDSCLDSFRCLNGICLESKMQHCDGKKDCIDGSDEIGCHEEGHIPCHEYTHHYQCHLASKCIDIKALCDNNTDCPHGDDESPRCASLECSSFGCETECLQTPSGPRCLCQSGYELDHTGKKCKDINECLLPRSPCSHICTNRAGGYVCHCRDGYRLAEGGTCVAENHEALIVFSADSKIHGYYFLSRRYFEIGKSPELGNCTVKGIDMDSSERSIYFVEICNSAGHVHAKSVGFNGDERDIVMDGLRAPIDVAVDSIANNIYIADNGLKQIIVCQKQGNPCTVLIRTGIEDIKSIVLYHEKGLMFWSDWGRSANIYQANMDGTSVKMLIKNDTIHASGLTIDRVLERLYWADIKVNRIEYWDFANGKRMQFYHEHDLNPYHIGIFEDKIYFTSNRGGRIDVIDKSKRANRTRVIASNGEITAFHLFHPLLTPKRDNPCWDSPCSHLCLLKQTGFSCVCPNHLELDRSGYECVPKPKDPFLLVSASKQINRVFFESIGRNVLVPVWTSEETLGCLTYDWNAAIIYIFHHGNSEIVAINLKDNHYDRSARKVFSLVNQTIHGLTYDGFTNNLYWLDPNNGLLEIGNSKGTARATLLSNLERPTGMALYQEENKIYIANLGSDPHILQTKLDGSRPVKFISLIGSLPTSLFLCKRSKRLYWSEALHGTVEKIDLHDEQTIRSTVLSKGGQIMSILVHNDTLYWTSMHSGSLWFAKMGGSLNEASRIDLRVTESLPITKYILYAKEEKLSSECLHNNGGCSHICVSLEGHVKCLCPPKHKLVDGYKCELERHCAPSLFACDNDRTCLVHELRCDHRFDCEDGSDEAGCGPACPDADFRCSDGFCIPRFWQCDGVDDCKDKSDEANCTSEACNENSFRCSEGKCIEKKWVCDGLNDCFDGSDEKNCSRGCGVNNFQCKNSKCLPLDWRCDGETDCSDGSDEANCPEVQCSSKQFKCTSGTCIDAPMECDRLFDCSDHSDEHEGCVYSDITCPPDLFRCSDGHCIYPNEKCDGYNDCNNQEDEENCPERTDCPPDQVRCGGNKTVNCIPRKWLCDNANDCGDWWDETSPQCTAPNPETTTGKPCRDGSFPCRSGDCIDYKHVCDNVPQCLDGSDEGGFCMVACQYSNGNCSQICHASPSGGSCACHSGFFLDADGKTCVDIDECSQIGYCSQFCNNYPGGAKCTCDEGYNPVSEGHKCKANGTEASLLYMLPNAIKSISLHTQTEHSIVRIRTLSMKGMDYDYQNRTVYWIDGEEGKIKGIHYAGGQPDFEIISQLERPSHLSWDFIGRNFYFIESDSRIAVCSEKSKQCGLLIATALAKIDSFVVSPKNRIMFWSSWSAAHSTSDGRIERAEMDGSKRTQIISYNLNSPSGLTVDPVMKLIYWVDTKQEKLYSANFKGTNIHQVLSYSLLKPLSIGVFEDYIYWANTGADNLMKCNKFTGGARVIVHKGNIKAHAMKVFHEVLQRPEPNPCDQANCSHICLLSLSSNYTCSCPFNHRLSNDGHSCTTERFTPSMSRYNKACDSNPCLNNGICKVTDVIGRVCDCTPDYEGISCEIPTKNINLDLHRPSHIWIVVLVILIFILLLIVIVYRTQSLSKIKSLSSYFRPLGTSIVKRYNGEKKVAVSFKNPAFDGNLKKSEYKDISMETEVTEAMLPSQDEKHQSADGRSFSNPLYGQYMDDSDQRVFIKV